MKWYGRVTKRTVIWQISDDSQKYLAYHRSGCGALWHATRSKSSTPFPWPQCRWNWYVAVAAFAGRNQHVSHLKVFLAVIDLTPRKWDRRSPEWPTVIFPWTRLNVTWLKLNPFALRKKPSFAGKWKVRLTSCGSSEVFLLRKYLYSVED